MAQDTLETQPSETLIELFFECDEPDERDELFDALARRDDPMTVSFLTAVLDHDEDPFMQVAAAAALWPHDPDRARTHLMAVLQTGGDALLFEDALSALLLQPEKNLFELLQALSGETGRDVTERRLARVALTQLDETRALEACREVLQQGGKMLGEPVDLLGVALMALVQSGSPEDVALVEMAARRLPPTHAHDDEGDDLVGLRELLAEAQALMAAQADPQP